MNGKQLKNSILQLAIQGKLVPQDPNDEPASELLKRIRAEKEQLVKEKKLKKKDLVTTPISDEEKPFEVPEGWEWCRLGDVAFVTKLAGFEYTKYIADNLTGSNGVPLFKGKNVQSGEIIYDFEAYIPEKISDELSRSQITKPCLLTPYVGTIGNIGYHKKKGKFHLGSNVGKIEFYCPDEYLDLVNSFTLLFLRSKSGLAELSKYKKATAQESISIQAIREVLLPLPPLAEQQRIVAKIEELMPLVEEYDKALPNKLTSPEWQAAEKEAKKEKRLHVPGTTAIPTGLYTVGQNISKKFHGRRLYLRNVPGFDGIMIHEGNTPRDTAGCILVGENTQRGRVNDSKAWLETVNKMVMTALNNLETVVVRISG